MTGIVKRFAFIEQLLPEKQIALSDGNCKVTYKELIEKINHCSQWLSLLGVKVIALHGQNSIDWVVMDLSCQEADIVCIPLPTFFTHEQIRRCTAEAGVDVIISDQPEFDNTINQKNADDEEINWVALSAIDHLNFSAWRVNHSRKGIYPDETQKITFTSGSTGSPKGVCLSEHHQWLVAQSLADVINIKHPRHLCLLPLSTLLENIAGIYAPLLCGGSIVLPGDNARGLKGSSGLDIQQLLICISQVQPETLILIPQLLTVLVGACQQGWKPPASLKFIAVGGAKVSAQLMATAQNMGLPVYQGYGLSECGSVVALNTPEHCQIESVGNVLPHCEVCIENSEILVTGANHLGYLAQPQSWYPKSIHTGDLGNISDGYLSVNGRKKNILITSFGRNVSPEWVEAELNATPMFSHYMVIGDGRAFLSLLFSAPDWMQDDVISQWITTVNQKLPDYARVSKWHRVDESEMQTYSTANGRLQRERVEQAFSDEIEKMYTTEMV